MARERTKVFQMRLLPDEHELLLRVSKKLGMPAAVFVRSYVIEAARRLDAGDAEGYRSSVNSTAVYHASILSGKHATPAGLTTAFEGSDDE